MFSVPYSNHSCFVEIQEFIELVQPTNMKGIVSSSSCYVGPLYYFGRLCGVNQPLKRFVYKNERKKGGKKKLLYLILKVAILPRQEGKKAG
jgi:DNA cross-link repair 1B protein